MFKLHFELLRTVYARDTSVIS